MLFFCAVGITMIIYSPYILSNAQIGLLALALFDVQLRPFKFGLHPKLKENWLGFWKSPIFWMPSLMLLLVLVGFLYSTDINYGFERLVLKLPFLGLPFAFYCLPRLSKRAYMGLFYFLIVILFITNVGIGINYLLHFDAINEGLLAGRPIPTPRNHVRYSLLLSMGIAAGGILYYHKFYLKCPSEKWLILCITLFNFAFIHVLSVRSGLVILYSSLLLGMLSLILLQKKYLMGLGLGAALILLPAIAYQSIPSFHSRVSYAMWEYQEIQLDRTVVGSDMGRVQSVKVGWEIFKAHPIIGVGAGDLRQAVRTKYRQMYPEQKHSIMPHNQFLSVAAGSGILGLIIFLGSFLFPLFSEKHYRDPFFLLLFFTFFLSFMVENTLENSIGIGFFCLFLCMGLSHLTSEKV